MTRKSTAHGRKLARQRAQAGHAPTEQHQAMRSPVGVAVQEKDERDSRTDLSELMTGINVRVYLTPEGERDHKLLASLALMLAIGTELGLTLARHSPKTKQVHAALRAVIRLCMDGGHWQAVQAKALHEAAQLALVAFLAKDKVSEQTMLFAYWLAERVRCGTARLSDVVGAEIYNRKEVAA